VGNIGQQSPRKYYELTKSGKRQLKIETEAPRKLAIAVEQVLEGA